MKQIVTKDYYIELGELREIIQKYFKEKTGEEVALCHINVEAERTKTGFIEFKSIHINIQEEV